MPETIRTFIAVPLPQALLSHLDDIQEGMKSHGLRARWVRPQGIHLTLKFLGDIKTEDVETIADIMSESAKDYAPFSLSAKGIGVFPNIRRPRVIWAGLKGDTYPLIDLQKRLEENLETIGFPKESRPFKAHLTLARIKNRIDAKKLADAIREFGTAESESFAADHIVLYQSVLKPTGAIYTKLRNINLKG